LAVSITITKLEISQNFLLAYIRMAIPYRTAKFKSANILAMAILGSTAKFNPHQYFRLYGIVYVIGGYSQGGGGGSQLPKGANAPPPK
jgi:hypothetical protein